MHNLGNVFTAHLGVENAIRHNRNQRPHLAEALASAFGEANLIAGGFGAQFENHLQPGARYLAFELLEDLHGSVGDASGPGTYDDPPHLGKCGDSVPIFWSQV